MNESNCLGNAIHCSPMYHFTQSTWFCDVIHWSPKVLHRVIVWVTSHIVLLSFYPEQLVGWRHRYFSYRSTQSDVIRRSNLASFGNVQMTSTSKGWSEMPRRWTCALSRSSESRRGGPVSEPIHHCRLSLLASWRWNRRQLWRQNESLNSTVVRFEHWTMFWQLEDICLRRIHCMLVLVVFRAQRRSISD